MPVRLGLFSLVNLIFLMLPLLLVGYLLVLASRAVQALESIADSLRQIRERPRP